MTDDRKPEDAKHGWAGPAVLAAVALALAVFFWWLLIATNPGHQV